MRLSHFMMPLLVLSMLVRALAADDGPAAGLPADPAFSKYVDGALLDQAIESFDAAQMADVTLLLAEGERVLGRTHAAMTADDAFAMTIQYAAASGDRDTIERLVKASVAGRKAWNERAEQVRGLIAGSRAAAPLDTEKYSDAARETVDAVQTVILAAKATSNAGILADIEKAVKASTVLAASERDEILKLIATARGEVAQPNPEVAALIQGLSAASRENSQAVGTLAIELDTTANMGVPINIADLVLSNDLGVAVILPSGSSLPAAGTIALDLPSNVSSVKVSKKSITKIPVIKGGFPPKITYKEVRTLLSAKTIKIPKSFGLTGKAPVKSGLK